MTARVYIETSIISYLTGRPSRDVVVAGHQALTRRWWRGRRAYNLFVSQAVLDEAALGDPVMRTRRLKAVRGIPRLGLTDQATELAYELVHRGALPKQATVDGFHIAIAAAHQVDDLLTWNCKHLGERHHAWYRPSDIEGCPRRDTQWCKLSATAERH